MAIILASDVGCTNFPSRIRTANASNLKESLPGVLNMPLWNLVGNAINLAFSNVGEVMNIRVSFSHFWAGFNPLDFFVPLLTEAFNEEIIVSDERSAHLSFQSVFRTRTLFDRVVGKNYQPTPPNRSNSGKKFVWYTAENIRPPLAEFDLTLSFDADSFGGKNVYLPYSLVSMNWWSDQVYQTEEESRVGLPLNIRSAQSNRKADSGSRQLFACAFVGNPEPIRLEAIRQLSAIGQVDVFGKHVGMQVPSKFNIARNYRFMLTFENDVYPGYVTEKAVQAWMCGCIPLWRGLDPCGILNSSALINAMNFESIQRMVDFVKLLDQDENRLMQMRSEPIFTSNLNLKAIKSSLQDLFTD